MDYSQVRRSVKIGAMVDPNRTDTPEGYEEVSRAWLFAARESWVLPVLSRGLLYVAQNARDFLQDTDPRLLCYDLRA